MADWYKRVNNELGSCHEAIMVKEKIKFILEIVAQRFLAKEEMEDLAKSVME